MSLNRPYDSTDVFTTTTIRRQVSEPMVQAAPTLSEYRRCQPPRRWWITFERPVIKPDPPDYTRLRPRAAPPPCYSRFEINGVSSVRSQWIAWPLATDWPLTDQPPHVTLPPSAARRPWGFLFSFLELVTGWEMKPSRPAKKPQDATDHYTALHCDDRYTAGWRVVSFGTAWSVAPSLHPQQVVTP